MDPQHLRAFLQQTKPTNLNQGKKSIFWLMSRERPVEQNEYIYIYFSDHLMSYCTMLPMLKTKGSLSNKYSSLLIKFSWMELLTKLSSQPIFSMSNPKEQLNCLPQFSDQVWIFSWTISKTQ